MKLSEQQWRFLRDLSSLIHWVDAAGWKVTGGELKRTDYQQTEYMRTGRSKTMHSNHIISLAIDFQGLWFEDGSLFNPDIQGHIERLKPMAEFWRSLNPQNSCGYLWTPQWDFLHFERRPQP